MITQKGTVTAGNASGINDGAAAVILVGEAELKAKNLTPLVEIVAFAEVGLDPICMGLGPIEAVKKVVCILLYFVFRAGYFYCNYYS